MKELERGEREREEERDKEREFEAGWSRRHKGRRSVVLCCPSISSHARRCGVWTCQSRQTKSRRSLFSFPTEEPTYRFARLLQLHTSSMICGLKCCCVLHMLLCFLLLQDWTFVCPTEIIAFSDRQAEFDALGADVRNWQTPIHPRLSRSPPLSSLSFLLSLSLALSLPPSLARSIPDIFSVDLNN